MTGLAAILWLCGAAASASERPKIEILKPPHAVDISTVSAPRKGEINVQPGHGGEPVLRDASLEASAVGPGYTLIPLPAFVYNPNEGAWAGILTPLFRANEKGQVEDIIAPLYLHNDLIGETFTLNYFGYRHGTRQFNAIVSQATNVERGLDLQYKDIAVGRDGRYIVHAQLNAGKSAFNRFYGFDNASSGNLETNYTMGDSNARLSFGLNLNDDVAVVGTQRFRYVSIENGVARTLPQTLNAFPTAPGLDGARVWSQGVGVQYDTRDNQLTPLKGTFATLNTDFKRNFRQYNVDDWWRITAEARHFLPHGRDRAVFVAHGLIDALPVDSKGLVREGVPFYERPTLGGETTLRGFGRGRFVSNFAVLVNLEERISLIQRSILGNVVELEIAPLVDIGRVGSSFSTNELLKDLQINPGVGVRLLARPNIASRLDLGAGKDGVSVFVGLDYPF
ncbi:MAG: BamA/TamA family outer membrane protein [Elusimicrobia bacterium]|nr:BamA/TamA family outer membrane protein [Elusimicrobiota bacterium]